MKPSGSIEEGLQRFQIFQPIRSHGSHLGCRAIVNSLSQLPYDHCPMAIPDSGWVWNKSEIWIWEQVNMFSFLSHKSHRFKWAFTITFHPASINCSHFDLLLKNHWTKLNRTWMWHSLDGPLPKVCSLILPYIQDGCHGFRLVEKFEIFEELLL
jgi:hypothetical protein